MSMGSVAILQEIYKISICSDVTSVSWIGNGKTHVYAIYVP